MTHPDHGDEPLDPEIDRLLEAERARPEGPGTGPDADRLLARVIATIGPLGGATGGGGAPPGAGGAGGESAANAALIGTVSLVIGMVAGAMLHAAFSPTEVRVVVREVRVDAGPTATLPIEPRPPAAEGPAPAPAPEPTPAAPMPTRERSAARSAPAPTPAEPTPPEPPTPTDLARESALLARAQAALGRGAPRLAIAALEEHAAEHPEGQLREEREALWVSALVAAGDRPAAELRARQFRARFPGSPLQPVIDAALAP